MADRSAILKTNKLHGSEFEGIFTRVARLQGFGVKKNPISGEFKWNGEFRPINSELDFTLVDKRQVSFFDTKSVDGTKLERSTIPQHQIENAMWFNELGITAGFIVFFRQSNRVVFFSGQWIHFSKGPLTDRDGVFLGPLEHFEVRRAL